MIIIDNFIKDQDLLDRIENDESFWQVGYRWYDGWWSEGITDIRHELIHAIWGENSPYDYKNVIGFEHWVGDYTAEKDRHERFGGVWALKPHFDKDEELWHNTKEIIGPTIGTVFYPCREIDEMEGGMLHYWEKYPPQRANPDGTIAFPEESPEVIKPKYNRLIIFDASCLHAVTEITKGRRRAIAINLWGHKPTEFIEKEY